MTRISDAAKKTAMELEDCQMLDSEFLAVAVDPLERVAEIVKVPLIAERERCAMIADKIKADAEDRVRRSNDDADRGMSYAAEGIAAAIRYED